MKLVKHMLVNQSAKQPTRLVVLADDQQQVLAFFAEPHTVHLLVVDNQLDSQRRFVLCDACRVVVVVTLPV